MPAGDDVNLQDLVEEFLLGTEGESFDFNTLFEDLAYLRRHPLDLNTAGPEELAELRLLNDLQITQLLTYRETAGPLLAVYELQAVPGFDLATIRRILPFVRVSSDPFISSPSIWDMIARGRNDLYLRWERQLETKRGYTPPANPGDTRYLGDPNEVFMRFRHQYENKLSYGFTAQKDPGEPLFRSPNRYGFDFFSAHFFLRDVNKRIESLALGDFAVSFGQGLLIHSGFGTRKSAFVMNIKRNGRTLRPYTSVDENNFMRGAGLTLKFGRFWKATLFASYKGRDASIQVDTLEDVDENLGFFTSLLNSGFHRTPREIENKNALRHFTSGARLHYDRNRLQVGLNAIYDQFDKPFNRNTQPYNRFYFSGRHLLGLSADYTYMWRNFHFFGETARSDNGAVASVNGLLAGLDRSVDLAVFHRYMPRDYQSIMPNTFSETAISNNETGLYLGLEIRPVKTWRLSAYADFWKHPWLRYQVDAPSQGSEYFVRGTYYLKRKAEIYVQYRVKTRERNVSDPLEEKTNFLVPHRRHQLRFYVSNQLNKELELRSRLEFSLYEIDGQAPTRGFMIYQDVLYKPLAFPLSFTARFALFDAEDFNSRIYAYENDLIYSFSIPAFFNRGMRYYLNLRYRGIRNLSIELRLAQTVYTNIDGFGSGLETTPGNTRTELKAQVKYDF